MFSSQHCDGQMSENRDWLERDGLAATTFYKL
jgi:hypothetical protein